MKKVVIGYHFQEKIKIFLYLTHLELVISQKIFITFIKILISLQTYIRIQDINSNLCGLFCILFCLYKVNTKNKFIEFINMFNVNDFIKNELV